MKLHSHSITLISKYLYSSFVLFFCVYLLTSSKTIIKTTNSEIGPANTIYLSLTDIKTEISIPPGMIFISENYSENNLINTIWLDNYDGDYRQIQFSGNNFNLSHDHQTAVFEHTGDIFLMDLKNGTSRNISSSPKIKENFILWSPDDDQFIVLAANENNFKDIFLYNIKNENFINISNTSFKNEVFSGEINPFFGWWPQQSNLIFAGQSQSISHQSGELLKGHCTTLLGECNITPIKISLDTNALTYFEEINGIEFAPSLSANGNFIAFDGGIIYNFETNKKEILNPVDYGLDIEFSTNHELPQLVSPMWSPHGEKIAWIGHTNPNGDIGLYLFDLENDSGKLLTSFQPYFVTASLPAWQRWSNTIITWSPDGKWLTLSDTEWTEQGETASLWIFSDDGKTQIKIDTGDYGFKPPIWSPDSKRIVFSQIFYGYTGNSPSLNLLNLNDYSISHIKTPQEIFLYPLDWFDQ